MPNFKRGLNVIKEEDLQSEESMNPKVIAVIDKKNLVDEEVVWRRSTRNRRGVIDSGSSDQEMKPAYKSDIDSSDDHKVTRGRRRNSSSDVEKLRPGTQRY
jgi:hypothetical protein